MIQTRKAPDFGGLYKNKNYAFPLKIIFLKNKLHNFIIILGEFWIQKKNLRLSCRIDVYYSAIKLFFYMGKVLLVLSDGFSFSQEIIFMENP